MRRRGKGPQPKTKEGANEVQSKRIRTERGKNQIMKRKKNSEGTATRKERGGGVKKRPIREQKACPPKGNVNKKLRGPKRIQKKPK